MDAAGGVHFEHVLDVAILVVAQSCQRFDASYIDATCNNYLIRDMDCHHPTENDIDRADRAISRQVN
jgi:hypothetical protein